MGWEGGRRKGSLSRWAVLCRGGPEQVRGERKSTLLQLLRRRCVHRKISWRWMEAGERMRGDGWETTRRREERGDGEKKFKKKRRERKRRGRINWKVGEGAFSDEIRSRGRSEFGYLIHERGKNRVAESKRKGNGEGAQVRLSLYRSLFFFLSIFLPPSSSRFLRGSHRRKWDYADPALQTALYSPHLRGLGRIDNWQNWYSVGGRATCAPGLETRISPAAVASIFLAKLHPVRFPRTSSPAPRSFMPLSLFSITKLLRRKERKRVIWRNRQSLCFFFLCDLKTHTFFPDSWEFCELEDLTRSHAPPAIDEITSRDVVRFTLQSMWVLRKKKGIAATIAYRYYQRIQVSSR